MSWIYNNSRVFWIFLVVSSLLDTTNMSTGRRPGAILILNLLSKSDTLRGWNLLSLYPCQVYLATHPLFFIDEGFFMDRCVCGKVLWGHVLHCLFSTFSPPLCCGSYQYSQTETLFESKEGVVSQPSSGPHTHTHSMPDPSPHLSVKQPMPCSLSDRLFITITLSPFPPLLPLCQ